MKQKGGPILVGGSTTAAKASGRNREDGGNDGGLQKPSGMTKFGYKEHKLGEPIDRYGLSLIKADYLRRLREGKKTMAGTMIHEHSLSIK